MMKIILAGTPFFSIPTFEKIINNFEVVAIISQPDRPIGRKKVITSTPAKLLAQKYKIKLFQPNNINDIFTELSNLKFDVLLTMAYGQIIPDDILKLSRIGSFNIHASLLPKYRGASPIQYAILNGEKETGITFMEMTNKMDAGDIIFQSKLTINDDDNADLIFKKLSELAEENIINWLNDVKNNKFKKIKQNEDLVSFAPKIQPLEEKLFYDTVEKTWNKIRALSSNPGAYFLDPNNLNRRVKIFKASKTPIKNAVVIKCKDGFLYGTVYQIEGRNKISLIHE